MLLYLDTARLGQMCPEAQRADRDFAGLAGEEGCSMYFENFLRWGFTCLPPSISKRFPGLAFWAGVSAFKRDLKTVLAVAPVRQTLVANRSAQLVRLAARLLTRRCENILVTDMEWPAYTKTLRNECRRSERVLTTVPVRDAVLHGHVSKQELVENLVAQYARQNCDGLFLSAVTHHGVKLPVAEIVRAIPIAQRPRFVAVDGAQALNHIPLGLAAEYCDMLLTGCHKWLRAYHPMGLALCCRQASEKVIAGVCREMMNSGDLDDPLLDFTNRLETGDLNSFSETVNLAPMFTAAAAVRRMMTSRQVKQEEFSSQIANALDVAQQARASGWQPIRSANSLRSGILLLQAEDPDTRLAPVERLRERFRRAGVALSAYDNAVVRTSMPDMPLSGRQFNLLHAALCRCA